MAQDQASRWVRFRSHLIISTLTTANRPNPPTTILVDKNDRVFAIRGTPSGSQTPEDFKEGLLAAMLEMGKFRRDPRPHPPSPSPSNPDSATQKKKKHETGKRGEYKTITLGVSHGTGTQVSFSNPLLNNLLMILAI